MPASPRRRARTAGAAVTGLLTAVVPLALSAPAAAASTTVTVSGLVDLARGATIENFQVDVTNAGTSQTDERLDLVLSGLAGLATRDVTLSARNCTDTGAAYATLSGSRQGDGLTYRVAPTAGAPLGDGQTRSTCLRLGLADSAPLGTLTVTGQAVSAGSGVILGSGAAAAVVFTTPGAPGRPTLTSRDASLGVSAAPSTTTGNSPITGYRATAVGGGRTVTADSSMPTLAITGLTNGVPYSVTVRARNRAGFGPASPAATAVPAVPPLALTLTGGPVFVRLGTTVTFSGRVTRGGVALNAALVTLTVRYSDGADKPLGVATTRSDGGFSLRNRPLYNGTVTAEVMGATVSVPSRVVLTYAALRSRASGRSVTVTASTTPGFVTGPGRAERAQLVEVDTRGRRLRVLSTVNAASRRNAAGQAQGLNDIRFRVTLSPGQHRLVVKVIGTPVNTGAKSRQLLISA